MKNVLFLDWDDTLFALNENEGQYCELQYLISRFLCHAFLYFDRIYIITNAQQGWVEYCVARFLPELAAVINDHVVAVFSARTLFEEANEKQMGAPTNMHILVRWKLQTMVYILSKEDAHGEKGDKDEMISFMSVGDSQAERIAALTLPQHVKRCLVPRCILLASNPTFATLKLQLVHLTQGLFAMNQKHVIETGCDFSLNSSQKPDEPT